LAAARSNSETSTRRLVHTGDICWWTATVTSSSSIGRRFDEPRLQGAAKWKRSAVKHPKIILRRGGVKHPARRQITAFIVLKPGETLTPDEVKEFCKIELAEYKVPREVRFREELPKTMVGKALRRQLAAEELAKQSVTV
jgi:hypothetical protein